MDPILSDLKGELNLVIWRESLDFNHQIHILIHAFEYLCKTWLMRLKIDSSKGYLNFVDLRIAVGWKQKSRQIHDSNA
jgi:hypothetical protein